MSVDPPPLFDHCTKKLNKIVVRSETEALEVTEVMKTLISRRGYATVLDLYELLGMIGSLLDYHRLWLQSDIEKISYSKLQDGLCEVHFPEPQRSTK